MTFTPQVLTQTDSNNSTVSTTTSFTGTFTRKISEIERGRYINPNKKKSTSCLMDFFCQPKCNA